MSMICTLMIVILLEHLVRRKENYMTVRMIIKLAIVFIFLGCNGTQTNSSSQSVEYPPPIVRGTDTVVYLYTHKLIPSFGEENYPDFILDSVALVRVEMTDSADPVAIYKVRLVRKLR